MDIHTFMVIPEKIFSQMIRLTGKYKLKPSKKDYGKYILFKSNGKIKLIFYLFILTINIT